MDVPVLVYEILFYLFILFFKQLVGCISRSLWHRQQGALRTVTKKTKVPIATIKMWLIYVYNSFWTAVEHYDTGEKVISGFWLSETTFISSVINPNS